MKFNLVTERKEPMKSAEYKRGQFDKVARMALYVEEGTSHHYMTESWRGEWPVVYEHIMGENSFQHAVRLMDDFFTEHAMPEDEQYKVKRDSLAKKSVSNGLVLADEQPAN